MTCTVHLTRAKMLLKDRDQVEDSELASKELGEGIPSSVADLKDHPLCVLYFTSLCRPDHV